MLEPQHTGGIIMALIEQAELEMSIFIREEQLEGRILRWGRVLELQREALELVDVETVGESHSIPEAKETDSNMEERLIQLIEEGSMEFSARPIIDQIANEGLFPDLITTEKEVYAALTKLVWDGVISKGRSGTYGMGPEFSSTQSSNGH